MTSPVVRFAASLAGCSFIAGAALAAAPFSVEEKVLFPVAEGLNVSVSPHGGHAAAVVTKDGHSAVVIDGVAGPTFDAIGITPVELNGAVLRTTPGPLFMPQVMFSTDGAHYAYLGRNGAEWSVVFDGKVAGREVGSGYLWGLKSVVGGSLAVEVAGPLPSAARVYVNGTAGASGYPFPWQGFAFTPDGDHYAYVLSVAADAKSRWTIADGKQSPYTGDLVGILSDGRALTQQTNRMPAAYFLDGKPIVEAGELASITASPHGAHWAAITTAGFGKPRTLTIDGKVIPEATGSVQSVFFSPDGKRWAALCAQRTPTSVSAFVIVDGKKEPDYAVLTSAVPPGFSPDSSRFAYGAMRANRDNVFVLDGAEADPATDAAYRRHGVFSLRWSEHGGHYAIVYPTGPTFKLSIDGREVPFLSRNPLDPSTLNLSPDFSRFAGASGTLSLDGAVVPDFSPRPLSLAANPLPTDRFVVFSPDSKHCVYAGIDGRQPDRHGVWMDGKLITAADGPLFNRVVFTPDGRHVAWAVSSYADDGTLTYHAYLDGREAIHFNGSALDAVAGAWELEADGTLTVIGIDTGLVKRWRVSPLPDSSVDVMLAAAAS